MNIKIISSIAALILGGAVSSGVAQAASESTERSFEKVEKSTSVEIPRGNKVVEESSTTTTKRGLFGRKKSETTTSSTTRYDRNPDTVTSTEVKSRTKVETDR